MFIPNVSKIANQCQLCIIQLLRLDILSKVVVELSKLGLQRSVYSLHKPTDISVSWDWTQFTLYTDQLIFQSVEKRAVIFDNFLFSVFTLSLPYTYSKIWDQKVYHRNWFKISIVSLSPKLVVIQSKAISKRCPHQPSTEKVNVKAEFKRSATSSLETKGS